jgi:hypothetical protein
VAYSVLRTLWTLRELPIVLSLSTCMQQSNASVVLKTCTGKNVSQRHATYLPYKFRKVCRHVCTSHSHPVHARMSGPGVRRQSKDLEPRGASARNVTRA